MREYVLNSRILKQRRRELRRNQTPEEKLIWEYLRGRKLKGFRFARQYSIGPYILDFYCPTKKLAIELDGKQHQITEGKTYDQERNTYLEGFGVKTLRFKNAETAKNVHVVIETILHSLSYP